MYGVKKRKLVSVRQVLTNKMVNQEKETPSREARIKVTIALLFLFALAPLAYWIRSGPADKWFSELMRNHPIVTGVVCCTIGIIEIVRSVQHGRRGCFASCGWAMTLGILMLGVGGLSFYVGFGGFPIDFIK